TSSFRQAAEYQEGRTVRNSRQARAMAKGSKSGRREQEEAWQNAEVAARFRLAGAGVRVPPPEAFRAGVG
ncbi:RIO1 family regulatory kinase/ATPase domain-containing protein, partial [Pseudomonas aeruginosa]